MLPSKTLPNKKKGKSWRAHVLVVGLSWLFCEFVLWTFVGLPHPYVVADPHRFDRQVLDQLQGAPSNRYLPSYHQEALIRIETDGVVLPGVSGKGTFTINSFGFRSPRLTSLDKPSGWSRVFCIGGSTTECLYLDDAAAWPERLQQGLVVGTEVDVVNAGHSGDVTRDHLALLAQRIVPFQPDVVLVLSGINDCFQQMAPDYSIMRDDGRTIRRRDADDANAWKSMACDVSQTARMIVLLTRSMRKPTEGVIQDTHGAWIARERVKWREAMWTDAPPHAGPLPEFEQNLRSLVGMCRAHGVLPVLLTQPAIWGATDASAAGLLWRRLPNGNRVAHVRMWHLLEAFNDVTRRVAADTQSLLIDLANELPKDPALFYDDDHFNIAGCAEVAAVVAAALLADAQVAARLGRPK